MDNVHANQTDDEIGLPQPVSIRVINADGVPAQYANLITVNFDRASFHVVLSQFLPPVILHPEEAQRIVEVGYVPATLVARLVFTPLMVEETIAILQQQLTLYREQHGHEASSMEVQDV